MNNYKTFENEPLLQLLSPRKLFHLTSALSDVFSSEMSEAEATHTKKFGSDKSARFRTL